MKRTTRLKLTLTTETLRTISEGNLAHANGGISGNRGCNFSQPTCLTHSSYSQEPTDCQSGGPGALCG